MKFEDHIVIILKMDPLCLMNKTNFQRNFEFDRD